MAPERAQSNLENGFAGLWQQRDLVLEKIEVVLGADVLAQAAEGLSLLLF